MSRGKLIVLEGLDRAGKSTQCIKLVENLSKQGHQVRSQRFPDRTTIIGRMIDDYLKGSAQTEDHVIHLLFSANRWEAASQIEADLANGITVVVDRYIHSGMVYSAAKHNPSLSLDWARKPDEGLPRPDVCIFLSISLDEAAKRGGFGHEKYEKKEMQDRVRQLFLQLRTDSPDKDMFVEVDGSKSTEEVENAILLAVTQAMRAVDERAKPLELISPW